MDADKNLLAVAMALLAGLIDRDQFNESCKSAEQDKSPTDNLINRIGIAPDDLPHLEYLVERSLSKNQGNAAAAFNALFLATQQAVPELQRFYCEPTYVGPVIEPESVAIKVRADTMTSPTRYDLMRVHAYGGIGRVWVARDCHFDREVAVKELLPETANNDKAAVRFVREARLTGQLEHPGIVPVYEMAEHRETRKPFYAMRLVRGRTLSQAIRSFHRKRMDGELASLDFVALLTAFVAICNTVAYAHSRNVVHRDLKGDNVILGDFGEVIVLDWGLAKVVGRDEVDDDLERLETNTIGGAEVTVDGQVIGTPAYMASEQAEGRLDQIDQRTDICGLGAMLYSILTGQAPFTGRSVLEVLRNAACGNTTPPRRIWPEAPLALEAACLKAMSPERDKRFASASELAQVVQRWQDDQRREAENALRRQTEILRSILNGMSEGVLGVDAEGNLLVINSAAERLLGQPTQQSIASTRAHIRFYRPDTVSPIDSKDLPLERAIAGEEVNDAEMFVRPTDEREPFWVNANARPLRDENGRLHGGVVVFHDITQRKRVESELLRSRERFELAVRGSQDGVWDWDLLTGEVYFSPRWKAILGYEDHELANALEEWQTRLHPDDRDQVLAVNHAHINGATPHYEYEYRLRHKDGSYRWVLARGVALRDAEGKAYRMSGSHVDTTDRKRAEEERGRLLQGEREARAEAEDAIRVLEEARAALRASEEQYRSLADLIPGIVWTARADGWIDYANQFWFTYTGMSLAETQGDGWTSAVHPEDRPRVDLLWSEALKSGAPVKVEYRIKRTDGAYRWFLAQGQPLRDGHGKVIRWFGMLTETQDLERAMYSTSRTC